MGFYLLLKLAILYKETRRKDLLGVAFSVLTTGAALGFGHFIVIMSLFSVVPGGDGFTGLMLYAQSQVQRTTMLITLLISHGYSFYYHFIIGGEKSFFIEKMGSAISDGQKAIAELARNYFLRIVFLQCLLLVGIAIIGFTGIPVYLAIVFILAKTGCDVVFHKKAHQLT